MPRTVPAVVAAGSLRATAQPGLTGMDPSGPSLRPWVRADAPWMLDAYRDPGIRFWHAREVPDLAEARALIARYAQDWDTETKAHWAIVAADGEVLGRVSLSTMNLADGEAEIGYWVRTAARGRGTSVSAVNRLSAWAFGAGFHRLVIHHSVRNPASCAVAGRAGYALEGTKRSALLHDDGWHDMHLHARIAP